MKMKWLTITLSLLMFITIGCEDNNESENGIGFTGDIGDSAQLLSFSDNDFVTSFDIEVIYENRNYLMKLNGAANVLAIAVDTTFADAELPVFGYTTDTTGYFVIGDSWMDLSTYNGNDNHSIQTNGTTYFIRTTNYDWIKLEVLIGSQLSMTFKYAFVDGDGTLETVTVEYSEDVPVYYNFASAAEITPGKWDLGFVTIPVYYSANQQTYTMYSVLTNYSQGVEIAIISNQDYDAVTSVPGNVNWLSDTATDRVLGYGADFEVLNYHSDTHLLLIDNSNYVYLVKSGSDIFKIQFDDYADEVVVFDFAEL